VGFLTPGGNSMRSISQDLRFALRQFRKSPGFTITAIVSLALGIAATTAVFSVVRAVLLDPYPYANSDRMVHLVLKSKNGNGMDSDRTYINLTGPQLKQLGQVKAIESWAAMDEWSLSTTGSELPEDVAGVYLTANAFNHFGVPALLGRELIPADAPEGQDPQPVVVLGYLFWQRHYNGDSGVIGRTLQLVRKNYTIVGVTPPRFTWGDGDVYLPLKLSNAPGRTYWPMVKLKPGVSHAAANAELQSLMEAFAKETPTHFPADSFRMKIEGLNDQFVERIGGSLYLLFAAVALLLIIGCGNVSILLLARGTAREHEIAVRSAVGASRFRILRQLLTESLLLSLAGAILGVLLAYRILAVIVAWLPEFSFPHEAAIQINMPVLLFSVGLALLTGILFGLSPSLQLSRPDVSAIMQASSKRTGGVSGKRLHVALIAGQIALTLVLLAAAGAAIEGFLHLMHTNLGYDPHNTMSVGIPVHDNTYTTWEVRKQYFDNLLHKVGELPSVASIAVSTNATPPSSGWDQKFEVMGTPSLQDQRARLQLVSPEYFSVLQIALLQGRIWDRTENQRAAHVAVINQTLARHYFPNGDVVGHQIKLPNVKAEPPMDLAPPGGSNDWLQVVGVIADVRDDGLRKPVKPAIYVPYTIHLPPWTQLLVHTHAPPLSILREVRAQVRTVDPDQQVEVHVRDLDQWITHQQEWAQEHMIAMLFGGFAILAQLLAAVGLYSVVSYSVLQRTNEFGIRLALGARRYDVVRLVLLSTAFSVGGGLLAGLVLSLALNRVLAKWSESSVRDPLILFAVMLLMAVVSATACLLPARRASSVDPTTALRYE
jgi:predicted permease